MTIEWSRYATYCRQCGKAVRISQKTLTDQMERDGGVISEEDTAKGIVYCLACASGTVADGEVITEIDVAKEFCIVIGEWLKGWKLEKVILRNRAQHSPSVCHTHDFCDANMAMVEAFEFFGLDTPEDQYGATSFKLWNDAWDLAKRAEFNSAKVQELDSKKV